jgi:SAM-dependent methyltransferase
LGRKNEAFFGSVAGDPLQGGRKSMEIPERGLSLTHEHIFAIIVTELEKRSPVDIIRILDVGCGNGRLIAYFHINLPRIFPQIKFDIYGFDIAESGVQTANYFQRTLDFLNGSCSGPHWPDRIVIGTDSDPWTYPDGNFDFVVSNQVVEHVFNPDAFWNNINRTLKNGGVSIHLFPLRHYFYEGHLFLPLVHHIHHADLRYAYIKFLSRIGLGKFMIHHKRFGMSLDKFSEMHSDYIEFLTNYRSWREVMLDVKRAHLRVSFRYTQEFYFRKLRDMMGLAPRFRYNQVRNALIDWFWACILKYVSSITLFVEKRQTYVNPNSTP